MNDKVKTIQPRSILKLLIIVHIACGLLFTVTPSHALNREDLSLATQDPGKLSFKRFRQVSQESGLLNAIRLMFTEKEARGVMYHSFAGVPETCIAPNAWYIPEGQEVYCPEPGSDPRQGEKFVCGKSCPEDRQTGLACGMGHHCCLPESAVDPMKEKPLGGCDNSDKDGIKYCTF